MDVHRIVIGDQYYLQVEDALVWCVRQKKGEDLLSLPVGAISASARQRGVRLGMEAKEALLLLQKAQD